MKKNEICNVTIALGDWEVYPSYPVDHIAKYYYACETRLNIAILIKEDDNNIFMWQISWPFVGSICYSNYDVDMQPSSIEEAKIQSEKAFEEIVIGIEKYYE